MQCFLGTTPIKGKGLWQDWAEKKAELRYRADNVLANLEGRSGVKYKGQNGRAFRALLYFVIGYGWERV